MWEARERLFEQGVVVEIDLADGEVVGGAPVGVDFLEEVGCERDVHDGVLRRGGAGIQGVAATVRWFC